MFKKHKEKKQAAVQELQDTRDAFLAALNEKAAEAEKEQDPIARIALYQVAAKEARVERTALNDVALGKESNSAILGGLGGVGATAAAAAALAPVTGGISLVVGVLPIIVAEVYGIEKGHKISENKFKKKSGDYIDALDQFNTEMQERTTAVLEGNVEQIPDSPLFAEMQKDGGMVARFNEASLKYMMDLRTLKAAAEAEQAATADAVTTPAEETPKPAVEEKPVVREVHDYSKLTQVSRGMPKPKAPQ